VHGVRMERRGSGNVSTVHGVEVLNGDSSDALAGWSFWANLLNTFAHDFYHGLLSSLRVTG